MEVKAEIVLIGRRPMGFQQHVVDVVVVIARPAAITFDTGMKYSTDKIVGRAAERPIQVLPSRHTQKFQVVPTSPWKVSGSGAGLS